MNEKTEKSNLNRFVMIRYKLATLKKNRKNNRN